MSKLKVISNAISRTAGRGGLVVKKFSPEILMGVGIVGIVTSTVLACRATLKVDDVAKSKKEKIDKIKKYKEDYDSGNYDMDVYSDKDYKRDLTVTYVQTIVDYIKLYGPAVTLGVASIGCILGSYGIMRKRNVALIAAYKTVEQAFADYRKRVVDEYGEEKDRAFKHGIRKEKVMVEETDENGETKTIEKEINVIDDTLGSQYARFYDEGCKQWSKSPEYNLTFLTCQQNYMNDLLNSRGHVFLNEVYDSLGIPRTKAGQIVGWVRGNGDSYIDFGIFNSDKKKNRDFVNGYERVILLDFNVDGVIYDLI